jgi:endonuclease/exonuclease/phosphatase family metal-dependent hydrolase
MTDPPNSPSVVRIGQLNVRKTSSAHQFAVDEASRQGWDVLVLQEVWPDMERQHRGNYHLASPYIQGDHTCIYVKKDIKVASWHARRHDSDRVTLSLMTRDSGMIHIHNIYNHLGSLALDKFLELLKPAGEHLLLGDFNLHHRSWGGARVRKRCP